MEALATKAQYDARFPGRSAPDEVLDECLMSATVAIVRALDARGVDRHDPDDVMEYAMMDTCRTVANRIMPSGGDVPAGVTQMAVTAGPYSQTTSYTPSYGAPKLLPSELALLGIGGGSVGWAPLGGGCDEWR